MIHQGAVLEIDSLTYEQAFQELETVIQTLESGEQTLESSLELFERGQKLILRCMSLLENAELRVKQVSKDGLLDFQELE